MDFVSDETEVVDDHYHDASNHGFAWAVINELLHVIVFVFTLIGVINFRVKFITAPRLVRFASRCIVAFNFYLSAKFFLMAAVMYFHNFELSRHSIDIQNLNCTLADYTRQLPLARNTSSVLLAVADSGRATVAAAAAAAAEVRAPDAHAIESLKKAPNTDKLALLTQLVNTFGGPYKYLGNMATLIYGVYAIAYYIMLAIFPLELIYFVQVGFNFIRFVLSDTSCMREFYERRKWHIGRLCSWSRFRTNSDQTQVKEIVISQYNLRGMPAPSVPAANDRCQGAHHQLLVDFVAPRPSGASKKTKQHECEQRQHKRRKRPELDLGAAEPAFPTITIAAPHNSDSGRTRRVSEKESPLRDLKGVQGTLRNLLDNVTLVDTDLEQSQVRGILKYLNRKSHAVEIAHKNLRRFKPFVRSEEWFKASMIIYPVFIFFYFVMHMIALAAIQYYLGAQLGMAVQGCALKHLPNDKHHTDNDPYHFERWSFLDYIVYNEHIYSVFVLSVASSFYCSYYFSAILELFVWGKECEQQVYLSIRVVKLISSLIKDPPTGVKLAPFEVRHLFSESVPAYIDFYVNDFGGFKEISPWWKAWPTVKQFREPRLRELREMMAARLLTKSETLVRAAYINQCLFFDEHTETRFITTTILRRLCTIVAGFAFMASVTRSQFDTSYLNLNILLISSFVLLNVYMVCAAIINSIINKLIKLNHSLFAASVEVESNDIDMIDYMHRLVGQRGQDENAAAYTIYGIKMTWSAIVQIDSLICTVIFTTRFL